MALRFYRNVDLVDVSVALCETAVAPWTRYRECAENEVLARPLLRTNY